MRHGFVFGWLAGALISGVTAGLITATGDWFFLYICGLLGAIVTISTYKLAEWVGDE